MMYMRGASSPQNIKQTAVAKRKLWHLMVFCASHAMKKFKSVPWLIGIWGGGHEGQFSRDPLPVFSAGSPCEQFWHGQICPLFDVVHPAFPLLTTASPTLHGALKDIFGEACRGVWHAPTVQASVSWQLPEEVSVDPQESWSCFVPSRWPCTPSSRCGEVSTDC